MMYAIKCLGKVQKYHTRALISFLFFEKLVCYIKQLHGGREFFLNLESWGDKRLFSLDRTLVLYVSHIQAL